MKKVYIITSLVLCVALVLGFILWNNRTISTITLDINPSVMIKFGKNDKVKSVVALNDDAKDIITKDIKGKNLEESINILTNNVIEKGYADENHVAVIIHSTGNIENSQVENIVRHSFDEKQINTDIIVVDKISKDDEKLAKKNKITASKAAFINSIVENNEKIDSYVLVDKPVSELIETKNTGFYCDKDYYLEGSFCLKEIKRIVASDGMVCPNGYYDYEGTCYEEIPSEEKEDLMCPDEFTMKGNKCQRSGEFEAKPIKWSCTKGEEKTRAEIGLTSPDAEDANDIVCVDLSNATHPVTPCELPADDPTERMSAGGRCYWHRAPVIADGCPGKIQVGSYCWDDATNILICAGYRDGKQYSSRDDICEHSIKYTDATVTKYECEEERTTLKGNKCVWEEIIEPMHEHYCTAGYTLVNYDRCINNKVTANKTNGLVCDEPNSKLVGNTCIIYDIIDAKK